MMSEQEPQTAPVLNAQVRAFLNQQRVGHLATVSRAGEPYVVPVCYALSEGTIYAD